MMTNSDVFNYRLKICKELGWSNAAKVLNMSKETLRMQVRSVIPDFEVHGHGARKFYAEDVANMFELKSNGISYKTIAASYKTTVDSIRCTFHVARRDGFDAFPLMQKRIQ